VSTASCWFEALSAVHIQFTKSCSCGFDAPVQKSGYGFGQEISDAKEHRGEAMGLLLSTNVAGATHFYLALQVEWHFKMAPGTFAGQKGTRLTALKPDKKKILDCLMHMMMTQLRSSSSSAGGACTQNV
jgi:hypothetical protein